MARPSDHATTAGPPSANGHADRAPDDLPAVRPGRPPGPTARPAAIVFGIIFVLFVAGAVGAGLSGGGAGRAPAAAPGSAVVPGTGGLVAVAARGVLSPVLTPGEPPDDVVGAVVVPRSTAAVPGSGAQRGVGLYDATVAVVVPAAEQPLVTFFRRELAAGRWHVLQSGPVTGGGYRFLAQHPGSDGYEWELGLTVSPSTFTSAVPGMSVPPSGVTPVSLRLFAISDQS